MCIRYFNVAMADPDGELGERHKPETHLINMFPSPFNAAGGPTDGRDQRTFEKLERHG